jgi:trimethylamine-N-oxide reductase (cytochrome c)
LSLHDIAEHSELILGWGCDPITKGWWRSSGGNIIPYIWQFWKELGIKMVFLNSYMNMGTGYFADKWIPVLTGMDGALQLAISYIWFTEDTYDKDYISTHAHVSISGRLMLWR